VSGYQGEGPGIIRSGTFKHTLGPVTGMSENGNRPLDVLESSVDTAVTVDLKDGEQLSGTLTGYDQHMNLVVESDEDITIIRGDNVVSIRP